VEKQTNLYWSAGKDDPTLDIKFIQSLESLGIYIDVRARMILLGLDANPSFSTGDLRHKATARCCSLPSIL
jgi:hypothetical protein